MSTHIKKLKKCTYIKGSRRCLKKVSNLEDRCVYHQRIPQDKIFNSDCPICLESINQDLEIFKIDCGHIYHMDCMKGMTKMECPTCRSPIENFDKDMIEIVNINADRIRQENEIENFRDLFQTFGGQNLILNISDSINNMEELDDSSEDEHIQTLSTEVLARLMRVVPLIAGMLTGTNQQ